ncbi:MAG: pyridoxal phosphate-dependent aminotransferase [Eubacteriaceae bacterium]|nr:pyridoxal phosphate-dependent aminotransferase [Eubacteriaceae bacterium]
MISEKMMMLGKKSNSIRALFEYGKKRRAEIGDENVYDFSIGNPSVPSPAKVNETLIRMLTEKDSVALHGYTSNAGDTAVRSAIASNIQRRFGFTTDANHIYMTCGAASSLRISLNAIILPGDEVILLAPYFAEYTVFAEDAGARCVVVDCTEGSFALDFKKLEEAITEKTKAIIINSPNNPSGVVLSEDDIRELSELLTRKQKEYSSEIYIISDEPYRELVYGGVSVPYIPCFYDNTIICYSYSKSLSLPGERIGYIMVSPRAKDDSDLFFAVCGAGRALGYICAPSIFQYLVAECDGMASDISVYDTNRKLIYDALNEIGYTTASPDGAFYLFIKTLETDSIAFCERAKSHEILLVPGDDFGYPGWCRLSYCVTTDMIRRSIPAFRKLYDSYR